MARPNVARRTLADQLFSELDGRALVIRGEAWHLEVYSVCEQAGRRWVQMAVDGPRRHMVTLALATRAGVTQAVQALSQWLEEPTGSLRVVFVA